MKKLISIILFTFLYSINLSAATFASYPSQVAPVVQQIQQMPEVRNLLEQVSRLEGGPVRIVLENTDGLEALWDGENRVIRINHYHSLQHDRLISSLIFELHNASTNHTFMHLVDLAMKGRIGKDQWVEQVERMEHQNALKTSDIISKGIASGIFPASAKWVTYYEFDDYYKLQQIAGHSGWLANAYDTLNPRGKNMVYKGTIPELRFLSSQDKSDFLKYLSFKNMLSSPSNAENSQAMNWFKNEYAQLNGKQEGSSYGNRERSYQRSQLLKTAFKGSTEWDFLFREIPN